MLDFGCMWNATKIFDGMFNGSVRKKIFFVREYQIHNATSYLSHWFVTIIKHAGDEMLLDKHGVVAHALRLILGSCFKETLSISCTYDMNSKKV